MTQKEAFELVDHQLLMQMDHAVREAWQTLKSEVLSQPAHNNARDEMLPGCSGCIHLMHDQTLNDYPCLVN